MAVTGFGEIAEKLRRSTVLIHAGGCGSGSGVIWSSDGTIITNAHVVRGTQISLQLWDGQEFRATMASRDPHRDLAVLRIDATNLPSAFVADSSQVRPGELAIAIGNPLGFIGALTTGSFMRLALFEVSVHNRGYSRMFAWHREILAARLPTPVAA